MIFAAAVRCHMSLSDRAVCAMINTLQTMSLKKEPKEDVEVFADKIIEIGKRIVGTGKAPNDLHTMIYDTFENCSHAAFALAVSNLSLRCAQKDATVRDWESQLLILKTTYREYKSRNKWDASAQFKEATALTAALKKAEKGGSAPASTKNGDDRSCFHCGKKGHIKPNCPDKDTPKDKLKGSGGAPSLSTPITRAKKLHPRRGSRTPRPLMDLLASGVPPASAGIAETKHTLQLTTRREPARRPLRQHQPNLQSLRRSQSPTIGISVYG